MKYLILALTILFTACSNPVEPETNNFTEQSSSSAISSVAVAYPSLSSTTVYAPSSINYTQPSSTTPVVTEILYIAEVGYVCNGFNTNAVAVNKATEGYIAMYNICGDRATMTSGTQPRAASVINNWMTYDLALSPSDINVVSSDINYYGASLRFYNAVDGYLRYIYVEPVGDGIGLMKTRITN